MSQSARVFNDDLLSNLGDVEYARVTYPQLDDVLNWPTLRDAFEFHENAANLAKRASRRRGTQALLVALSALWLAAIEPRLNNLISRPPALWLVAGLITILGSMGVLLGSNILTGSRKHSWLSHRTAAERLRQLHFQVLVRRALRIALRTAGAREAFLEERERILTDLVRDLRPGVTHPADVILEDLGSSDCWLIGRDLLQLDGNLEACTLNELFEAYARLRFQHQINYSTKK